MNIKNLKRKNEFLGLVAFLVGVVIAPRIAFAVNDTNKHHSPANTVLKTVNSPFFDSLMVADSMTVPKERRIFIENPTVSFAESWLREYEQKTQSRYRERVKKDYSLALLKQLKRHLKEDGWKIVDTQQNDALRLQAHLRDLDIESPDISTIKNALVTRIGVSEIDFMLYDLNNELILEASDRGAAGNFTGNFIIADNASNFGWFNRLMSIWAQQLTFYATLVADTQPSQ